MEGRFSLKLVSFQAPDKERVNKGPLSDRSDDDLMGLARAEEALAFDTLVRRHQHMVFRIAVKYLGDENDAKDVTQNSFVEVYRYLGRYKPRGHFVSFLGKIVLNQCKMVARARRYRNAFQRDGVHPGGAHARLPADELLAREQRRVVAEALARLSPKLREVLVLRFSGDLSYKEIAATLNLRIGTVKSRLFAGLNAMNRLMEATRE